MYHFSKERQPHQTQGAIIPAQLAGQDRVCSLLRNCETMPGIINLILAPKNIDKSIDKLQQC